MHDARTKTLSLWTMLVCAAIVLVSWFVQQHSYINPDVSWHLWVGSQLANGRSLYDDIIEVNFPLIYYLAIIPYSIAMLFDISPTIAEQLLTNLLACGSLALCVLFTQHNQQLSSAQKQGYITALSLAIFIIPLCLSVNNIGQKEHKFLLLTLPYTSYILARHYSSFSLALRILTVCMAVIGFSIKPHFALLWITIELARFFLRHEKPWKNWETWLILIGGSSYAALCFFFFPAYIDHIIPLARSAYLMDFHATLWHVILQLFLIFQPLALPLILILAYSFKIRHPQAHMLSFKIIASFVIATFLQRKAFDYQLLPFITYSLLIAGLIIPIILGKIIHSWQQNRTVPNDVMGIFLIVFLPLTLSNMVISGLTYNYRNHYFHDVSHLSTLQKVIKEHHAEDSTIILGKLTHGFPLTHYANLTWHFPVSSTWPLYSSDPEYQAQYSQRISTIVRNISPRILIIDKTDSTHYQRTLHPYIHDFMQHYTLYRTIKPDSQTLQIWVKNKKKL